MLFPYKYIDHNCEKLQGYIEHLVVEVWCKANGPFSTGKLGAFEAIVKTNKTYLLDPITEVYGLFLHLNEIQRQEIAEGFKRNNDIEGICNGSVEPIRYSDIEAMNKELANKINDFFKGLYYSVLRLSAVKKECGDLDEHYDDFMKVNSHGKCPFCGLADIKSDLLTKRDAYDHYLPKDIYPFNSVNFKNLVPACNTCNSSYKLAKDPLIDKATNKKRKTIYPFAAVPTEICFTVDIKSLDGLDPKKNNLILSITSATAKDEVDSWREVYGADERYLDKCRSEDAKLWLVQVLDELKDHDEDEAEEQEELTPAQQQQKLNRLFAKYLRGRKRLPSYYEFNFIRIPFLEDCMVKGYIK